MTSRPAAPESPEPIARWSGGICKTCGNYTHSCKCNHPKSAILDELFSTKTAPTPCPTCGGLREQHLERQLSLAQTEIKELYKLEAEVKTLLFEKAALVTQFALAQAEIKGHMRVKDDLEKRFVAHTKAVEEFLNALYAIMVDPCAEGVIKVDEMKALLISAAIRDREAQARIAELEKDWETDADYVRMAERIKELEKLLGEALENLIWCGGSADFGWGGKAQVGYDKGPRTTIVAIHAVLKSRA